MVVRTVIQGFYCVLATNTTRGGLVARTLQSFYTTFMLGKQLYHNIFVDLNEKIPGMHTMFKIRFPRPLTFLRRRAARPSVQLPKVAVPLLFAPPAPRLVPVTVDRESPGPKSGFVL
jgi:hypothetical protein